MKGRTGKQLIICNPPDSTVRIPLWSLKIAGVLRFYSMHQLITCTLTVNAYLDSPKTETTGKQQWLIAALLQMIWIITGL